MQLHSTLLAADPVSFSPELVGVMSTMLVFKGAIQAWTVDVVHEGLLVGAFVNAGAALRAPEIAFGFFEFAFSLLGWLVLLVLEEVADDLQSGQLFTGGWCLWTGWLAIHVSLLLEAWFSKPVLKLLCCEGLVHPGSAGVAGISTSVWDPPVMGLLPGPGALLDEVFLLLFGLLGRLSGLFVVQVVLFVIEDLLQPLDGMRVDGFVIPVKGGLPFCVFAVVKGVSSLPCRQCCISLASPELWFISRRLWCPGVAADVEDCDALAVLLCDVC